MEYMKPHEKKMFYLHKCRTYIRKQTSPGPGDEVKDMSIFLDCRLGELVLGVEEFRRGLVGGFMGGWRAREGEEKRENLKKVLWGLHRQ